MLFFITSTKYDIILKTQGGIMKLFKKLNIIFFSLFVMSICFSKNIQCIGQKVSISRAPLIHYQAEKLYKMMNNFLAENKDVSPEKFDVICRNLISKNVPSKNLLNKTDFEKNSKLSMVLYRGLNKKEFAENLKAGNVYIGSNAKNLFGMGIYATDSLSIAKMYSDKKSSSTVIKMLMPTSDIKILENKYLEKLKKIICTKYSDEFGEFLKENKQTFIDKNSTNKLFKNNKAALFYNSGLLTKLLGFDCLHVSTSSLEYNTNEYLVVKTDSLYILNE